MKLPLCPIEPRSTKSLRNQKRDRQADQLDLGLSEIALMFVRVDHVAVGIVNANHNQRLRRDEQSWVWGRTFLNEYFELKYSLRADPAFQKLCEDKQL